MTTMRIEKINIKDLEETIANSTPLLALVGAGDFAVEKFRAARDELADRAASFDPKAFRDQAQATFAARVEVAPGRADGRPRADPGAPREGAGVAREGAVAVRRRAVDRILDVRRARRARQDPGEPGPWRARRPAMSTVEPAARDRPPAPLARRPRGDRRSRPPRRPPRRPRPRTTATKSADPDQRPTRDPGRHRPRPRDHAPRDAVHGARFRCAPRGPALTRGAAGRQRAPRPSRLTVSPGPALRPRHR